MKTKLTTLEIKQALRNGPFAWPGGYPLFFITSDGAALSFKSVRENWRLVCDSVRHNSSDGWKVIALDVNYEDPALYCDHSGERIESAYSEDSADYSQALENCKALDELGEPFPDVDACIAAGQSAAFLASSTASALAEIRECETQTA